MAVATFIAVLPACAFRLRGAEGLQFRLRFWSRLGCAVWEIGREIAAAPDRIAGALAEELDRAAETLQRIADLEAPALFCFERVALHAVVSVVAVEAGATLVLSVAEVRPERLRRGLGRAFW